MLCLCVSVLASVCRVCVHAVCACVCMLCVYAVGPVTAAACLMARVVTESDCAAVFSRHAGLTGKPVCLSQMQHTPSPFRVFSMTASRDRRSTVGRQDSKGGYTMKVNETFFLF